jgi:hypothetical protein
MTQLNLSPERIKLLHELLDHVARNDPDRERRRIAQGLIFSLNLKARQLEKSAAK